MKTNFEELVRLERAKQEQKWDEQNHKPSIWLAILIEEVGEISSGIIATEWKPEMQKRKDIGHEIVQVAAVCKAMYESMERNNQL